ncbi:MFS transporter [Paenibacillus aurantius]|uniref:MFS transporter n=1 Tax=Paenibacillus aurantius TaxID=2918900 RepID=A0AA96RHP0_9BACL|nr:MFS transporter [Paenibacillus aurantius]WNQ13573.1 MFS transporter [Paenibacillus aurantius]
MKKQLLTIVFMLFTVFVGFGIIIPVLPAIIVETGNNNFHLAMLLSVYSAVSFFMSPFWGGLSDRIGRKPVILTGLLGFSISFLIFGLSDGVLWMMYLSRIIGGLFSGAVASCAVAYVADITTEENRTKGMGFVGMAIGMGFVFGPAIGGILSVWGSYLPFYASGALSFLVFLFALSVLKESLTPDKRHAKDMPKPSRWTAFQGKLKYLYVLSFFVSFTLAGLESTFQLFELERVGATSYQIGWMFLANGIVGAAIQGGVVRRLRGKEKPAIALGLALSAAGFFLLLLSSNLIDATLYLAVFGAGNALIRPCVTSLITQRTTVGQGVATGLNSSMDSLGRILGPLLAVAVFNWQTAVPFIIGGVLCLAALLLLSRFAALDTQGTTVRPPA